MPGKRGQDKLPERGHSSIICREWAETARQNVQDIRPQLEINRRARRGITLLRKGIRNHFNSIFSICTLCESGCTKQDRRDGHRTLSPVGWNKLSDPLLTWGQVNSASHVTHAAKLQEPDDGERDQMTQFYKLRPFTVWSPDSKVLFVLEVTRSPEHSDSHQMCSSKRLMPTFTESQPVQHTGDIKIY